MSRRYLIGILVVVSLALGGWALAQQEHPVPPSPAPEGGPYAVSSAGDTAVLVDTMSGRSWVLRHSVEGDSVWLPTKRIDSREDAARWRAQEKELQEILAQRAKAHK